MIDIKDKQLNIVALGDVHVTPQMWETAIGESCLEVGSLRTIFWGPDTENGFATPQLAIERGGAEAVAFAEGLEQAVENADLLITHFSPIPEGILERGRRLKAVLTCRGGLEHIDVAAATRLGIPVVNVIRNAVPVAEFTLGMMFAVTRNIAASHHSIINGEWRRCYPNDDHVACLQDMKVGLAGLGNIGIELAVRLKALGVNMMAYDPYVDIARLERNDLDDIELAPSLDDLFSRADIISMHLRYTPETAGIVDARLLGLMKPSAFFINTARGGLVKQQELADALRAGRIAGAALDVFDAEPLPERHCFAGLENVVLTPHLAGTTPDALPRSPLLLMRELERILNEGSTERIVNYKQLKL